MISKICENRNKHMYQSATLLARKNPNFVLYVFISVSWYSANCTAYLPNIPLENTGSKGILKVFKEEIPYKNSCVRRISTIYFPQTSFLSILQTDNREEQLSLLFISQCCYFTVLQLEKNWFKVGVCAMSKV